jgi:hypothetical protein
MRPVAAARALVDGARARLGRLARAASSFVAGGAVAALVLWAIDVGQDGDATSAARLGASVAAFLAAGSAGGLVAFVLAAPARLCASPSRWRAALGALAAGGLLFVAARYALHTPFVGGGKGVSARFLVFVGGCAVTVSALAYAAPRVVRAASPAWRRRAHVAVVPLLAAFAALALACDRLLLVSLYERAHTIMELAGFLAATYAAARVLGGRLGGPSSGRADARADKEAPGPTGATAATTGRRPPAGTGTRARARFETATRVASACLLVWLVVFCASRAVRRGVEHALPRTWEQSVYLDRLVRRVRFVEYTVHHGVRPEVATGVQRLAERYETHDTTLDDAWTETSEPSGLSGALDGSSAGVRVSASIARSASNGEAPPGSPRTNVVVFFVDALRADVANDPATMPDTSAWMRAQTSFTRTYSTGSSTLLALSSSLNCRYDATTEGTPALLRVAHDRGMTTAVVTAKTAADYHRDAYPSFRFDHEDVVPDFDAGHLPTANEIVDRSLAWLDAERPDRFFLWVYEFDVHSWFDLVEPYASSVAARARFAKDEGLPWRYRVAARGVDQAFTRLREGLRARGLLDDTVIVFMSDHGEALGHQGFFHHTTFLWEPLLRVPLAIQAPGLTPRQIDDPVSLIDLPTTLARYIGPGFDELGCHGEDLLGGDLDDRRLPILFSATTDNQLVRVGLLGSADRKLVVGLNEGDVRLLRLPDEADVSREEPVEVAELLNLLVRSPIYPRP